MQDSTATLQPLAAPTFVRPATSRPNRRHTYSCPTTTEELPIIPVKLIFTQPKLFWTIKKTLDFHIFQHENSDVLQLVGYDSTTDTELEPHIFLGRSIILPRIQAEIKQRSDLKIAMLHAIRSRSSKGYGPDVSHAEADSLICKEIQDEVLGEYILSRIQPVLESSGLKIRIKQTQSEIADGKSMSIVILPPRGRVILNIVRPKKPDVQGFSTVLSEFNAEAKDLRRASIAASEFSGLSAKALENLQALKERQTVLSMDELRENELRARSKSVDIPMLTPQERWLKTMENVIKQKRGIQDSSDYVPIPSMLRNRSQRHTIAAASELPPWSAKASLALHSDSSIKSSRASTPTIARVETPSRLIRAPSPKEFSSADNLIKLSRSETPTRMGTPTKGIRHSSPPAWNSSPKKVNDWMPPLNGSKRH